MNPEDPAAKISISIPESLLRFVDAQCKRFRLKRSAYFQMLLDQERLSPRHTLNRLSEDSPNYGAGGQESGKRKAG